MKKTLQDGRTVTLVFFGTTEEERTQLAIDFTLSEETAGRLNNRGDLTPTLEDYLYRSRMRLVKDIIPDQPDTPEAPPKPAPAEQLYEEQPAPAQTSQQRRSRTPVV